MKFKQTDTQSWIHIKMRTSNKHIMIYIKRYRETYKDDNGNYIIL